jgi:hypothetical protein
MVTILRAQAVGILTAILLLALGFNGAVIAQDVGVESQKVQRLIRDLDADTLSKRDAAEKALVELGVEVIPLLPPLDARVSSEVAMRLQRIRKVLDEKSLQAKLEGKRFNLKGSYTVKQALSELESDLGIDFVLSDQGSTQIMLDLENATFWKALDQVLDRASLDINTFADQKELVAQESLRENPRSLNACYEGAFRAEATMVEVRRSLVQSDLGRMEVSVQFEWEPDTIPVYLQVAGKTMQAKLDNGQVLKALNANSNPEFTPVAGSLGTELALQFIAPPRTAQKIDELKFEIQAILPGSLQTFRFDELDKKRSVKLKHGDMVVTLESPQKSGELMEFNMSLSLKDNLGVFESYRGWVLNNEAYVEGPDGKKFTNQGFHTTRLTEDEVGISYFYEVPEDLKGYVFVYEVPGGVVRRNIPIQLKSVALP